MTPVAVAQFRAIVAEMRAVAAAEDRAPRGWGERPGVDTGRVEEWADMIEAACASESAPAK